MKKLSIFALASIIILSSIILSGCGSEDQEADSRYGSDETRIQNLIFYNTWEIRLEITKNTPEPLFAWNSTGMKYVILTVFRSRIDVKDNQIANPEEAIWTWNTGMGRGREGNVSFSDGRNAINGEIQNTVTPLVPGTYFVAAWAYDSSYNLYYSSKEYQHTYYP